MKIIVDGRERKRIPYLKKLCKTWGWEYEVQQLKVGDFVCGNTVIEYKTMTDFFSSIRDGRLKKETINQANHYPYHFVLIVGDFYKDVRWFNKFGSRTGGVTNFFIPEVCGAISSTVLYTNVILCPDTRFAFQLMKRLFEKCNKDKKKVVVPVEKLSSNPVYNFLACSYGVGNTVAEKVVDTLELTNLVQLCQVTEEELLSVPLVGKGRAKTILKAIKGDAE